MALAAICSTGGSTSTRIIDSADKQYQSAQAPGCNIRLLAEGEDGYADDDAYHCRHGIDSCQKYQHRQEAACLEIEAEEVAAYNYQDGEDDASPNDAKEQSSKDQMVTMYGRDEGVLDALGPHVEQENIGYIDLGHLQNGQGDGTHQQESDHRLVHLQEPRGQTKSSKMVKMFLLEMIQFL